MINIVLDIINYILIAILIGVSATWIALIKSMLKTFNESPFLDKFEKKEHEKLKVSIILPARNEEKFVGKCLESFVHQDYTNYEIIAIDDSSKIALKQLTKLLSENEKIEDLQNSIYSIAKENQVQPKDFFKLLYQIILSTERGPKIGPFIEDIGTKNVADTISKHI